MANGHNRVLNMKKKTTTTKRKPQARPGPLDWDFHEIEPWEVRSAVRHEYARECHEKMEQLAQWMTPKWYAVLAKGAAKLNAAEKANDEAARRKCYDDKEWWQADMLTLRLEKAGFAKQLIYAMMVSLEWGLDWRQPWLTQRSRITEDVKHLNSWVKNPECVFVEKYPPRYQGWVGELAYAGTHIAPPESNHEQRHWWNNPDVSRYVLHIDWGAVKRAANSKGYLVKSIRQALQREWVSQTKRRVGRQAADPFPKLRALAAWRWNNADYSHDEARKLIRKRARELGFLYNSRKKIGGFPDFSDSKHWREAICETEKEFQHLRG